MVLKDIKKIIIFGGGDIFLWFVRSARDRGFELSVVTSQRQLDEILPLTGESLKDALRADNFSFMTSIDVNNDEAVRKLIVPGVLGLSFSGTWLFKKSFIDLFKGFIFNLHGTYLPKFRGGGGFTWQILQKDYQGGSTLHEVAEGFDVGRIIKQRIFDYPCSCRIPKDYIRHQYGQCIALLEEFFVDIQEGREFHVEEQEEALSTYWPRLSTIEDGFIDWSWSLRDVEAFICAFDEPYVGASTFLRGKRVFLKHCSVKQNEGPFHPFQDGIVFRKDEEGLFIAKTQGALHVRSVKNKQGVDVMPDVRLGDRFYTQQKYLDQARASRILYSADGMRKSSYMGT